MGNSIEPNTKEYYQLQSEYWFNECCKCTNACNELINDIEEVKRKAEAFDFISNFYTTEIEQAIRNKELNQCLFLLDQILGDLERGSDE